MLGVAEALYLCIPGLYPGGQDRPLIRPKAHDSYFLCSLTDLSISSSVRI